MKKSSPRHASRQVRTPPREPCETMRDCGERAHLQLEHLVEHTHLRLGLGALLSAVMIRLLHELLPEEIFLSTLRPRLEIYMFHAATVSKPLRPESRSTWSCDANDRLVSCDRVQFQGGVGLLYATRTVSRAASAPAAEAGKHSAS